MSSSLNIAIMATLAAGLSVLAKVVSKLGQSERVHSAEIAALADQVAQQEKLLAVLTAPAASEDREPKAVFVPARRWDLPESKSTQRPVLIAVPDLAPPPAESVEIPANLVQRFGAIWDLADSGVPIESIARATGHPIGELELILGLRRTRASELRG